MSAVGAGDPFVGAPVWVGFRQQRMLPMKCPFSGLGVARTWGKIRDGHRDGHRDRRSRLYAPLEVCGTLPNSDFRLPTSEFLPFRRGLTLIEILVVVAIISVLMGLLLPAIQGVREAARRTACGNNLRQIGLALGQYHNDQEAYPVGCIDPRPSGSTTQRQLSWCIGLLPYLEQRAISQAFDTSQPFDSAKNRPAASQVVPGFLCPSTNRCEATRQGARTSDGLGATDYGGMYGTTGLGLGTANGVMLYTQVIRMSDVTDGLGQTIIVAEDTGRGSADDGQWANGQNIFDATVPINSVQNNEIWSDHPGGAEILLCDGAVRFLAQQTPLTTLRALCTRAAGDYVPGDTFQ